MRAAWASLIAIVVVTAIAIAYVFKYGVWANAEPGPGLFPLLASLLIMAAAPAVVWELRRRPAAAVLPSDESVPTPGTLVTYIAVSLAWPLLLQPLGYAAASLLALLVLLLRGRVGWILSIIISATAVGASYLLFNKLLDVPLPVAVWF